MDAKLVFQQLVDFERSIPPHLLLANLALVRLKVPTNLNMAFIEQISLPIDLQQAVNKRKLEFLLGRYCASKALSYLKVTAGMLPRNKDRTAEWPKGYIGSISHTEQQAIACAASLTNYTGVGIDIEKVITADFYPALKNYVIMPSELAVINKLTIADKLTLATLLFSAKESLYKLLYKQTQCMLDFSSAVLLELTEKNFSLMLMQTVNDKYKEGDIIHGYYALQDDTVITLMVETNES